MEDVKSLSQSFSQLESGEYHTHSLSDVHTRTHGRCHSFCVFIFAAKKAFNFKEYNFSQCTLEQVRHPTPLCSASDHVTAAPTSSSCPLCLCPTGVHGVCEGAGERGSGGGLAQHHLPVAASASGWTHLGQPGRQHRASALSTAPADLTPPGPQRLRVNASSRSPRDPTDSTHLRLPVCVFRLRAVIAPTSGSNGALCSCRHAATKNENSFLIFFILTGRRH